jgi:hypothetical protein
MNIAYLHLKQQPISRNPDADRLSAVARGRGAGEGKVRWNGKIALSVISSSRTF